MVAAWFVIVGGLFSLTAPAFGQAAAQPATKPADNELLGFSRYLPADTRGYISGLQFGKLRGDVAASNAWKRISAIPEVKQGLEDVGKRMESGDVPAPVRVLIDLLKAAGESEISLAVAGDSSQDILNLARVALTTVAVMAPSPHAPDTLQGQVLETKRGPLHAEWIAGVPKVRMPSFVFAARVNEPAKYRAFIETMLDLAWQAASAEIDRKAVPEFREPLKKAYSHVKIGEVGMIRFRLRLGDVLPLEGLAEGLDRLPLADGDKQLIIQAIADLSIDAHLGFLGEYLTLAIGSDDRFIKQIVERFEGRSKETLAASAGFATIRAELAPASLAIIYADNSELQRELQRSILPLINKLADPELHSLLEAPAEITVGVQRMQFALESAILNTPLRQEAVVKVDQGLKQYLRSEYDRKPAVVPTKPLATLAMIPEKAIGYSIVRNGTMEHYLEQVKFMIAQQRAELETMRTRFGAHTAEILRAQLQLLEAMAAPIDEKLLPSLKGEMAVVMGGFADFGVKEGKGPPGVSIRGIPIPTLALLVHTAEADKAISGVGDIFKAIVDMVTSQRGGGGEFPVEFVKHDLDGIETWIFKSEFMIVDGLEPHFAKVNGALVFSTSFELTKKMRDTAKGTSPNVATAATHAAMKDLLPVGAEQVAFLNGAELNRSLRSTTTAVFGLLEKSPELFGLRARQLEQVPNVKRAIEMGLTLAECLRGSASSIVSEGKYDVLREWVHLEDLKAK